MNRKIIVASLAAASGLFVLAQGGAEARIPCDGNFQIVDGRPVATPYCRDWNLVRVARTYGWRVSFEDIRYKESVKAQVCRAIGHDNRVEEVCGPYINNGGDNRYPR
jgi:hypothetical protein